MNINERQRVILLGVLTDQQRLASMPPGSSRAMSRQQLGRYRIIIREAQQGMVRINLPGWLGRRPTNSECVLFHREYARLEDRGLIERCSYWGGRRTTHLKLTPSGRRIAEQFLAEEYGLDGGDQAIDWATVEFEPLEMPVDSDLA